MDRPSLVPVLLMVPALFGLLWARWRDNLRLVAGLKALCSALFLAAGFLEAASSPRYGSWMRAGLVLALVGDMFMVGKATRWVALGLVAFLGTHVCYLVAVSPLVEPTKVGILKAVLIGLPLVVMAVLTQRAAWAKLGSLRGPATFYAAVLVVTAFATLTAWASAPGGPGRALLGLGGMLFLVSDIAVARQRFIKPGFANRVWGLPSYYAAQLLLALSIGQVS